MTTRPTLEKGIRERKLVDGTSRFDVQDGTKPSRITGSFRFADDAKGWKHECRDRRRRGEPRRSAEDYRDAHERPDQVVTPAKPTAERGLPKLAEALDQCLAAKLEEVTVASAHCFRANVIREFLRQQLRQKGDTATLDDVTRRVASKLPKWLSDQHYAKSTAVGIISSARWTCRTAARDGLRSPTPNPFEDLKARPPLGGVNRRGRGPDEEIYRVWSPTELLAIARCLPDTYRLPFWIAALTGLRLSEVMGLQLGDWRRITSELRVERQRTASPKKGTRPPKTEAGRRFVPVTRLLADAIDSYIERHHGARPTSPSGAAAWDRRYLVIGSKPLKRLGHRCGPMNPSSFTTALKRAYERLGMTPQALGFSYSPSHQLRHGFNTEFLTPKESPIAGALASIILGHNLAIQTEHDRGESRATARYRRLRKDELALGLPYLDNVIHNVFTSPFGIRDLLELDDDLTASVALEEAARSLGSTKPDVLLLVREGTIRAAGHGDEILRVSREDVEEQARKIVLEQLTTYSAVEAAQLVAIDRGRLNDLRDSGLLDEVTTNPAMRIGRCGGLRGTLPGGGRRFTKASVHALMADEAWRVRIDRATHWWTITQAAAELGCSPDRVRSLADAGEIDCYRDFLSPNMRYLRPDSVIGARYSYATLSVDDVAARTGRPRVSVVAAIRAGQLRTSKPLDRRNRENLLVSENDVAKFVGTH